MARDYMAVVQGLLAKAQSTTHPEEADAFLAKAQEMMARHAIDEAVLAAADGAHRSSVEQITITCEAPYASAKTSLLTGIAAANDCRSIRVTKGADQTIMVIGYSADLAHVEALYTHLSMQATRAVLAERDSSRRYRHAFLLAFAARVDQRLTAARRQAQADYERDHAQAGGSVALVLADRRHEVDRWFQPQFPRTRESRMSASSGAGLVAGRRAGDRADLGGSRLDTPTRGAIGRDA